MEGIEKGAGDRDDLEAMNELFIVHSEVKYGENAERGYNGAGRPKCSRNGRRDGWKEFDLDFIYKISLCIDGIGVYNMTKGSEEN